jgi:hypothetical protein
LTKSFSQEIPTLVENIMSLGPATCKVANVTGWPVEIHAGKTPERNKHLFAYGFDKEA